MVNIKQLIWCNSYLGSTRKLWNNNMSFFIIGHKFDVFFLNLTYINFLLLKSLSIIKKLSKKKKKIIFIIPTLVLKKSKFLKRKKPLKYIFDNLKKLSIITMTTWVFGLLTNFKRVNKEYKIIPISILPVAIFVLINKITDDFDYLNIVREANRLNIISFGLVDTNQNPLVFDYPILANSKAFETTSFFYRFFVSYLYICNLKIRSNFYNNLLFFYRSQKKRIIKNLI